MSQACSRATSLAHSPQPYASDSIARALRLVAMVKPLISWGLDRGGSFCGSFMCQIFGRQIVAARRDAEQEAHPGHDQILCGCGCTQPLSTRCSWKRRTSSAVGRIGRTFEPGGKPLQLELWLRCVCGSSLRAVMSSIIR